ncbi:MAG: hypothetical protein IMZ70_08715, partial [Candidatus Atribacteria bacterium]|nr:hypothetical protein [Candidatus Atribacteria bacterium]
MLTSEITSCCRQLRLSSNIAEMSEKIQAENNQEYLLKLLKSEIERRESSKRDKLLK